jgi:hypothetical protein
MAIVPLQSREQQACVWRSSINSLAEVCNGTLERFRNANGADDCGIPLPTLDPTNVGAIKFCFFGQRFLREFSRFTPMSYVSSEFFK